MDTTVPSIIIAIGSVARPGSGPSARPTRPLSVITVIEATMNSVWPITRMATLSLSVAVGVIGTGPGLI